MYIGKYGAKIFIHKINSTNSYFDISTEKLCVVKKYFTNENQARVVVFYGISYTIFFLLVKKNI